VSDQTPAKHYPSYRNTLHEPIQVALDKELIKKLLKGLDKGAEDRALKVVVGIDKRYHINSKDMRITVEANPGNTAVASIQVENDHQFARITAEELRALGFTQYADNIYFTLRDKYSPYFHSLGEGITVFSRSYNDSIDKKRF
jgi:hypothetical protein